MSKKIVLIVTVDIKLIESKTGSETMNPVIRRSIEVAGNENSNRSDQTTGESTEFELFYQQAEKEKYDWFGEVADRLESDAELTSVG